MYKRSPFLSLTLNYEDKKFLSNKNKIIEIVCTQKIVFGGVYKIFWFKLHLFTNTTTTTVDGKTPENVTLTYLNY